MAKAFNRKERIWFFVQATHKKSTSSLEEDKLCVPEMSRSTSIVRQILKYWRDILFITSMS